MSLSNRSKKYSLKPACLQVMLCLLFMAVSFQGQAARHNKKKVKGVEHTMTVVAIRPPNNNEPFVRVSFARSQRFYKLPNDADPRYMYLLKASEKDHSPVVIKRAKEESDVILSVRKP